MEELLSIKCPQCGTIAKIMPDARLVTITCSECHTVFIPNEVRALAASEFKPTGQTAAPPVQAPLSNALTESLKHSKRLKPCLDCGHLLSPSARTCPQCGCILPGHDLSYYGFAFRATFIVCLALALIGGILAIIRVSLRN